MTKEALKLALEALESCYSSDTSMYRSFDKRKTDSTITAIKEALAQPEQKSVAMADYMALTEKYVALKATQRTWVGLTDGEIEVIEALKAPPVHPDFIDCDDWMDFARAIEFKLKEKNELR